MGSVHCSVLDRQAPQVSVSLPDADATARREAITVALMTSVVFLMAVVTVIAALMVITGTLVPVAGVALAVSAAISIICSRWASSAWMPTPIVKGYPRGHQIDVPIGEVCRT